MIADLKPYAEYKDSGLPWLGRVPGHWEIKRLKNAATVIMGQSPSSQDCSDRPLGVPFLQGCAEFGPKNPRHKQFCVAAPKTAPADSILLSVRAPVGKLNMADQEYGIGRGLCAVLVHQSVISIAYARYTIEAGVDGLLSYATGSTYGAVSVSDVGIQPIPLPPPDEQAAIVRFLDWANGRLERAIRAKRKVIALLNEQKQAIIHRAVTRGLDPSVPLKPSGIPWLGDIPAHWEVRQLRHMGRLHKGVGGSKEDITQAGVPCVRYGELYFHYRNFIRQPRGYISANKAAAYTPIQFGDVLFAASGERVEEIGKSAVNLFRGLAVCGGDVVIFRPTVVANATFLGYALDSHSAAHQKATMCRGTTIKHVYPDELRSLWFCVPPVPEQEQLAATLDNELRGCNVVISRLEREIDLLREYRTRLVADVVTGKLDVREAAARLPDEEALPDTPDTGDTDPDDDLATDEEADA
jgi:type I restriction enzyme S subunit